MTHADLFFALAERDRLRADAECFRRLHELLRDSGIDYDLAEERVFIRGVMIGPDRRVTYEG